MHEGTSFIGIVYRVNKTRARDLNESVGWFEIATSCHLSSRRDIVDKASFVHVFFVELYDKLSNFIYVYYLLFILFNFI